MTMRHGSGKQEGSQRGGRNVRGSWLVAPGVGLGLVCIAACARADPTAADLAAMQLVAATHVIGDIASNPGSIEVVCVGFAGDWEDAGLPELGTERVRLAYMGDCVEIDGRLVAKDGGAQAISVSLGVPELTGGLRAEVRVFTSTGAVDLAVYSCSVRAREATWRSEGSELEAIR
jgi:hypothetical protein